MTRRTDQGCSVLFPTSQYFQVASLPVCSHPMLQLLQTFFGKEAALTRSVDQVPPSTKWVNCEHLLCNCTDAPPNITEPFPTEPFPGCNWVCTTGQTWLCTDCQDGCPTGTFPLPLTAQIKCAFCRRPRIRCTPVPTVAGPSQSSLHLRYFGPLVLTWPDAHASGRKRGSGLAHCW